MQNRSLITCDWELKKNSSGFFWCSSSGGFLFFLSLFLIEGSSVVFGGFQLFAFGSLEKWTLDISTLEIITSPPWKNKSKDTSNKFLSTVQTTWALELLVKSLITFTGLSQREIPLIPLYVLTPSPTMNIWTRFSWEKKKIQANIGSLTLWGRGQVFRGGRNTQSP